jgi:hypothetical protein
VKEFPQEEYLFLNPANSFRAAFCCPMNSAAAFPIR